MGCFLEISQLLMVECNLMLKNSLLSENCCERGNNLLEEL